MMKKGLGFIGAIVMTLAIALFVGCDNTVAVSDVTLNKTEITVQVKQEVDLTAVVTPDNATDKTVVWSSDKTSVATVADGKVKGVSKGSATITATAGEKSATCKVTVLGETGKIMIGTTEYATIAAAVTAADANATIEVNNGEYTVTETITIDKTLKFVGEEGTLIKTSGTQSVFSVTAASVEFDGISILKTDKLADSSYAMFSMQADGFQVKNGTFTAQYALGDAEVTRAISPYAGVKGYVIEGNTFKNIRQPAYLQGAGTVNKNHIDGTRGWVVCCNYDVVFTDNTFATNAVDIAIISNNADNLYTQEDTIDLSTANNGAFVDNQILGIKVKNGAIVTE